MNMGASSGFQGSIFQIPPNVNGDHLAPKDEDPVPFKFDNTGNSAKPPAQPGNSVFDSNTNNLFGQNTPSVLPNPPQETSNIFGQPKPPTKLFSEDPTSSDQSRSEQPVSSMFGHLNAQQGTASTNLFGSNSTSSVQSQQPYVFAAQNEDSMSMSPDNSPQSRDRANSNSFVFPTPLTQSSVGGISSKQSLGGSLFSRISQPTADEASPPVPRQDSSQNKSHEPPAQNEPTHPVTPQPPLFGLPQAPAQESARNPEPSPTRSSKPMQRPSLGKPPTEDDQPAFSGLFGNIKVPAVSPTAQPETHITPLAVDLPGTPPSDAIGFQVNNRRNSSEATTKPSLAVRPRKSAFSELFRLTMPVLPADFTEDERRQFVIGYKFKCLDAGMKRYVETREPSDINWDNLLKFYSKMKDEILGQGGIVHEPIVGHKRKTMDDQDGQEAQGKKARFDPSPSTPPRQQGQTVSGSLSTINSTAKPLLTEPTPVKQAMNVKRKAEENLSRNETDGITNGAKRQRLDPVSYPSLSSPLSSQTSNIFKNILGNKQSNASPSATKTSTQNSDQSAKQPQSCGNSSTPLTPTSGSEDVPPFVFSAAPTTGSQSLKKISGGDSGLATQSESSFSSVSTPFQPTPPTSTSSPLFSSKPSKDESLLSGEPSTSSSLLSGQLSTSSSLSTNQPSITTTAPPVVPPKFGAPANFLSQFGKAAEETLQKEKASRKAEEFDSDEDDEAEWERKDAEERQAKKQKLDEALKSRTSRFVPGQGFILANQSAEKEETRSSQSSESVSRSAIFSASKDSGASVLTRPSQKLANGHNIFAHLSDAESGAEGSKTGDADDEDTESEEGDDHEADGPDTITSGSVPPPKVLANCNPFGSPSILPAGKNTEPSIKADDQSQPTGGLFDRISKDANGNGIRQIPLSTEKKTEDLFKHTSSQSTNEVSAPNSEAFVSSIFSKASSSVSSGNLFGQASPFGGPQQSQAPSSTPIPSLFGQPSTTLPTNTLGTGNSPGTDNTWKVDSPIKFGSSGSAPGVKVTSPSPFKPALGGLFGSAESVSKFGSGLLEASSSKAQTIGFGFGFGGPPKPATDFLAPPSNVASNVTSRATSPGAITGGESANESNADGDEETEKQAQLDLVAGGPGEEDEEMLFAVKARAMSYEAETKSWPSKGVGVLRVLRHRETSKTRILMRQDPSGKIVLNAALLGTMNYEYVKSKSVKMGVATDEGKLSSWIIRTGSDDDAVELAKILQKEKNN